MVTYGGWSQEKVDDGQSSYLPNFPVVREDKETTKVRVVYDSAARYGGISLNDTKLPGPKLQQDVFDVLLRFGRNAVALMADLTEMYTYNDRCFTVSLCRCQLRSA